MLTMGYTNRQTLAYRCFVDLQTKKVNKLNDDMDSYFNFDFAYILQPVSSLKKEKS